MVADFGKAFPHATILITAVGDPDSQAPRRQRVTSSGRFRRCLSCETLMLDAFAQLDRSP